MAERKNSEKDQYIYDNVVRRDEVLQPLPGDYEEEQRRKEKEEREARRRATRRQIQRDRKRVRPFSMLQTGILLAAAGGVLLFSKNYISLESELTSNANTISKLQAEYQELVSQNNILQANIDSGIDYDAIRKYAIEELGMNYPEKSQVITYDGVESEYVRQNDQIPKE